MKDKARKYRKEDYIEKGLPAELACEAYYLRRLGEQNVIYIAKENPYSKTDFRVKLRDIWWWLEIESRGFDKDRGNACWPKTEKYFPFAMFKDSSINIPLRKRDHHEKTILVEVSEDQVRALLLHPSFWRRFINNTKSQYGKRDRGLYFCIHQREFIKAHKGRDYGYITL